MKKNLSFILFFLIFIPRNSFTQSTKQILKLSMDQAVEIAHKNRPSLKAYKLATQASRENEKVAMADYFPKVNLSNNPTYKTEHKGLQNTTSLQASQLVYSFAGPLQNKKIAEKGTDISKLSEEEHKILIQYEVESSFLNSWLLQRKNQFIEKLNQSAEQALKKSEHQNKLNLLDKNTWLTDAATYAQNMSTVHYYTDELNNAQNILEYYIGKQFEDSKQTITLVWNSEKEINLKKLEYYNQLAMQNRKEIKIKQKEVEQYKEYKTYHNNSYLPNVSMSGNVSKNNHTASNSISLNFDWPLFDGGASFHKKNQANANMLKAMQEKESTVQLIKYQVQNTYYELAQRLKQLVAQNISVTQAQNEYDLKKIKYKIGDISKVDLKEAKYNWEIAKFTWLELKISAAIKERELLYYCGYPITY
jgi:outer membrane protein TolC